MGERILSVGGVKASRPISDFRMVGEPEYYKKYFVDGNVTATGHGKNWTYPYSTVSEALAASHAAIALDSSRQWAARNVIYVKGDDIVEDLDLLGQKTDVFGVGSSDNYPMPCIRGNHVPITSGSSCRFFNVRFRPTASEDLFTLSSTLSGVEFWRCLFDAQYSTFTAPSAIDTTAMQYLKVIDCDFLGAFSSNYIDIGAGSVLGMRIVGNTMLGSAANGVEVTDTTTIVQSRYGLIADNKIYCAGVTINDGADSTFIVQNNTCVSATTYGAGSHIITVEFAGNNVVVADGVAYTIPDLNIA